jgi:hypothetical protein
VSELFDAGARRLLARAYARPGQWAGTRLANPSARHLAYLGGVGIDPSGPDDKSGAGRLNARSRWARGFVRALYFQHKWWSGDPDGGGDWRSVRRTVPRTDRSLIIEVGRALPGGAQQGTRLLPGRAVRVKVMRGGKAHVRRKEEQVYTEGKGRSHPAGRDWG